MIVAPLVGVAALLARVSVTAAVPMDYGYGAYVLSILLLWPSW